MYTQNHFDILNIKRIYDLLVLEKNDISSVPGWISMYIINTCTDARS
jgi:hypothetical protein